MVGAVVTIEAARGWRLSRDISPKKAPSPRRTVPPVGSRTSTSPAQMKNIESPGSPRRRTSTRAG
ncbi:MAG: hypothetical protein B7Y08_19085 [Rhodospirillales bacterium 24-66-33]|nr:MAG: hypothetical protein B7Y08_19085 [Rhodospirillales bacterium 24-66-33]OZB24356.1 MAG: hypothetical protein B7X63_15755 [Rhodospirillales bacterium 39-66-50]